MAFGAHKLLKRFLALCSSKMENLKVFDLLTIHNDEISYIKHVLDPLCAFLTLFAPGTRPPPPRGMLAPDAQPGPVLPGLWMEAVYGGYRMGTAVTPGPASVDWQVWRLAAPSPWPRSGCGAGAYYRSIVWRPNLWLQGHAA